METYQERVGRYRIMRHEELPESHKQSYIKQGINPDNLWSLVWSFDNLEDAETALQDCQENEAEWQTHKIVDAGQEEYITRSIY